MNPEPEQRISELEEALKELEPLAAVGKLASSFAHELNNPLDSIRRFTNLALDQISEDCLAREYLLKAKTGIRCAVQIIRGLLVFSGECSRASVRTSEVHEMISKSLEAEAHLAALPQGSELAIESTHLIQV